MRCSVSILLLPVFAALVLAKGWRPHQGTIGLGQNCNPSDIDSCVYGANCYALNSMLIPQCGSSQATCNHNAQCAFNTCNEGICNGSPTNGTVRLGEPCSPSLPGQCANGASCYAVNYMAIPICGNYQASCQSDSQCASNYCDKGQCSTRGIRSSSNATTSANASATSTHTNSTCPKLTGGGPCINPTPFLAPLAGRPTPGAGGKTPGVNGAGATSISGSKTSPSAVVASEAGKSIQGALALLAVAAAFALFL